MKNILAVFLTILILSVAGCQSKEDVVEPLQITGKWQLVKVQATSMIANQPSTPEEPPYHEIFEFKADGTFRRSRSDGYEATGTYTSVSYGENDYGFLATFTNPDLAYHDLPTYRQQSSTKGQVYLRQVKPDELVESYQAFDGYSFFYQKVKGDN